MEWKSVLRLAPLALAGTLALSACTQASNGLGEPEVTAATVSATAGPGGLRADDASTNTPAETTANCTLTSTVERLSVRAKAAQLLIVGVESVAEARHVIRSHNVGGIVIRAGADEDLISKEQINWLRSLSDQPLLIGITPAAVRLFADRGLIDPTPYAHIKAETLNPTEVRELARTRGEQLSSMGVTVNFGPRLDLLPEHGPGPANAFSSDPQLVTQYARAYAAGLLDSGVTPVFRHFPGQGHVEGPDRVVDPKGLSFREVREKDVLPFADLVGLPGSAVMMGHVEVRDLTEPGHPASISRAAHDYLRSGDYGGVPYEGAIFSSTYPEGDWRSDRLSAADAVVKSLKAGSDIPMWITPADTREAIDRVEFAVESGAYSARQLDTSLARSLDLRQKDSCS